MYLHISLDDFFYPMIDLKETPYTSIFDQKDFAFLKRLHETYGMVCSCYCFFEDEKGVHSLKEVPAHYQKEFQANSNWLRFGFHARNQTVNYGSSLFHTENTCDDYRQAKTDYENVLQELTRITGGKQCIDHMPRIHYYSGTKADCQAWKDAENGIKGLLSAEDSRLCYYHTQEQKQALMEHGFLYENELEIPYFRTDIRLENEADLKTALERCADKKNKGTGTGNGILILFTHAPLMKNDTILNKMELCCSFAKTYGLQFIFPEDFIQIFSGTVNKEDTHEFS